MLWLLFLVITLQTIFHWLLKPAIIFSTSFFQIEGIAWVMLFLFAWLISGKTSK